MQDPAPQNPCVCREMIWKMVGDLHGGQASPPLRLQGCYQHRWHALIEPRVCGDAKPVQAAI